MKSLRCAIIFRKRHGYSSRQVLAELQIHDFTTPNDLFHNQHLSKIKSKLKRIEMSKKLFLHTLQRFNGQKPERILETGHLNNVISCGNCAIRGITDSSSLNY